MDVVDLGIFFNFNDVAILREAEMELKNHIINENCRFLRNMKRNQEFQNGKKNRQKRWEKFEFFLKQIICFCLMVIIIVPCVDIVSRLL